MRYTIHLRPSHGILKAAVLLLIVSFSALGQDQSQYDRGTPPQHAAGVSGFGSYVSADVGAVNLSNGSLNMKLPLGQIGGRGFSIPLTLNYSSKVWSASKGEGWDANYENFPVAYASYAMGEFLVDWHKRITPGWTIGSAPLLYAQKIGIDPIAWPGCGHSRYLTKLTVSLPDKGEIELRDDYTDGAPHWSTTNPNTGNCHWYDAYRGRRWHAADGSGTIFISDTDNGVVNGDLAGWLITSDGMRYRFVNTTLPYGQGSYNTVGFAHCLSITDRNGNVIGITYPSSNEIRYTDQLGRITRIQNNVSDTQTGQPLNVLVTISGYGGQPLYYKIKSGVMNQNYRSGINPVLPVINGAYNPMNYYFYPEPWWSNATQLFSESYCLYVEQIDNATVVTELVLPDGRSTRFRYNEYGEVAEVELPTGGKVQYDYAQAANLPTGISQIAEVSTYQIPSNVTGVDRAITARRTYPDGATLEGSWSYTYGTNSAQVLANSSSGTLLSDERHYFLPAGRYLQTVGDGAMDGTGYSLWSTGLESRSESRNAVGVVISAIESDWSQRAPVSWSTGYTQQQPQNDNRINEQRRILDDGSLARTTTSYDQYNNPIEVREYGFNGALVRRTASTYVTTNNGYNYADDTIRLLRLPLTRTIYNASSTQMAKVINEYDNYVGDGNHAPLQDYVSVTAHDNTYGTNKTTRGNLTAASQWLNTTGGNLTMYPRYDILGNVVSSKDPKGNITTLSFADDYGDGVNPGGGIAGTYGATYALPTLITSAPPVPGAPVHTARSQYDFSTGLLTGFRDRNNMITQTIYNDAFNRPTLVKSALGVAGVESRTAMYYAPATIYGVTLTKADALTAGDQTSLGDAVIRSWTRTDGFGRTTEAWSRDPQGDVNLRTIYDGLGRVKQTSNPHRPSLGEAAVYTTTAYDLASRVTSVTTPDNAVVNTAYAGNTVTVTDQAGKKRKSVTDALGRLTQVYEDPTSLNYLTSYAYDVLDNLTTVTQGTQTRTFTYDSLKRLKTATNPESGTINYTYDNNSNLLTKLDARSITTTFVYDALNRNTTVNYSNTTLNPDLTRTYDGATNGVGRLWNSYAGGTETTGTTVEHTKIQSYDALGRPLDQRQRFKSSSVWSAEYQIQRTYNRAGSVLTQTYPSGRTVTYSYDAAGRSSSFTGNLGDGTSRNYATNITYSSFGGLTREQFGTATALYHKQHFNIRGQLYDMRLSTVNDAVNWNRGAIINYYSFQPYGFGTSGPDNNGNLLVQQHFVPDNDAMSTSSFMQQNYGYDALNRINWVGEYQDGATETGAQSFAYDRWGNRTISVANGTGINNKAFTVNASNNRLGVPSGQTGTMTYDAAGNLTTDTYSASAVTRVYDADNRMTSETQGGGLVAGTYTYNADGQRVRRKVNGVETWQVYGMEGELLAEYALSGSVASPQKEYGYRNGELLVTAEPSTQTVQNVTWTGAAGVTVNGNSLTKTAATGWNNAGAASTQTIASGDGYVEFTATEINTNRMCGLSLGNSNNNYTDIDFAMYPTSNGTLAVYEGGVSRGNFGAYTPGTVFRVSVENGVVKYYRNGAVFYTSSVTPTYPLLVDTALYTIGATLTNVVIASGGSGSQVNWLVSDHLGTPRIIADKTGSLVGIRRHDYLPFGEELLAGTGGRTLAKGYGGDNGRQKFTSKERDSETGLDYFLARYFSSRQGRFVSPDEFTGGPDELYTFADSASANPTFYADLTNPESLNKYQYTYNNPLNMTDGDGHCPVCPFIIGGAAVAAYILLSPQTTHAPTPNDTYRERSASSAAQIVSLGAGEALGGPILNKVVSRVTGRGATATERGALRAEQERLVRVLHKRELSFDPATKGFRAAEGEAGYRLEAQIGRRLTRERSGAVDFVDSRGRTYELVGAGLKSKNFDFDAVTNQITSHLGKADRVAVDVSGLTRSQAASVRNFVNGLTREQSSRIHILQ